MFENAHSLVINEIFPCVAKLDENNFDDDSITAEHIRATWFTLLTDENFEGKDTDAFL